MTISVHQSLTLEQPVVAMVTSSSGASSSSLAMLAAVQTTQTAFAAVCVFLM